MNSKIVVSVVLCAACCIKWTFKVEISKSRFIHSFCWFCDKGKESPLFSPATILLGFSEPQFELTFCFRDIPKKLWYSEVTFSKTDFCQTYWNIFLSFIFKCYVFIVRNNYFISFDFKTLTSVFYNYSFYNFFIYMIDVSLILGFSEISVLYNGSNELGLEQLTWMDTRYLVSCPPYRP